MLIVRHGRIALQRTYSHDYHALFVNKGAPGLYNYFDPEWHPYYKHTELHSMQSVSKSVTSALIGIAIARGDIPSLDVNVMPYFSEFKVDADPRRDRMTLRHLLSMTAGIKWDEWSSPYSDGNTANNCAQMEAAEDWIQYVLDQPMATEPGTTFVYNSGATVLLSYILQKATGRPADEYAKKHLFSRLAIEYQWKRTPKGLSDTEGGLYLRPLDLAKLGYLYLHDGIWDGSGIVSSEWVKESTRAHTDVPGGAGYGYLWWIMPHKLNVGSYRTGGPRVVVPHYEAFAANGYGGQQLIVVPRLDLITVFTGWNVYDKPELDPLFAIERVMATITDGATSTSSITR
jgi:CubicO group peptidase (beta-lactamase class C family)